MIEFTVDSKQDKIYGQGGQGIEQVKRENLSWICEDEDVKSVSSFISPNSIEDAVRQDLPTDIAFFVGNKIQSERLRKIFAFMCTRSVVIDT